MTTTKGDVRSILFSSRLVLALLDGRKTQTRRVVRTSVGDHVVSARHLGGERWRLEGAEDIRKPHPFDNDRTFLDIGCPFGSAGTRLWVREAWRAWLGPDARIQYRADGASRFESPDYDTMARIIEVSKPYEPDDRAEPSWRPSIFMPRWASRIHLEIESVRVERLQAITDADIEAEGVRPTTPNWEGQLRDFFKIGWDEINGHRKGANWEDNPWVWALTFRRVD